MSVMSFVVDTAGWTGAMLLTVAYIRVSFQSIGIRNVLYQSLNIGGCALLVVNTAWHHAWPSMATNLVWGCVAVGAWLRRAATPIQTTHDPRDPNLAGAAKSMTQ